MYISCIANHRRPEAHSRRRRNQQRPADGIDHSPIMRDRGCRFGARKCVSTGRSVLQFDVRARAIARIIASLPWTDARGHPDMYALVPLQLTNDQYPNN
jgi:hypothetical protein